MADFTGTATAFNDTAQHLNDGRIIPVSQTIKCDLLLEANTPSLTAKSISELTLMSGGGYPGSITLTGNVLERISGKVWRFTANDIVFTATGGPITNAYYWVLWSDDDTVTPDGLIGFGQLDDSNSPVSAAENDSITIRPHATDGFIRYPATP